MNHFLTKQRAILKVYLINLIDKKKMYGMQYLQLIREAFKEYGYIPKHSEIYKALHELTRDGIVYRTKKLRSEDKDGFQEIIIYQFTEEGHKKAQLYKKQVKADLERSRDILSKVIKDNY